MRKPRRLKGVVLVFEQVMLFTIGLIVFMACFVVFSSYQLYFTNTVSQNQYDQVGEMVASQIIMLSENQAVNSSVMVKVPESIGNQRYYIRLSQAGINITPFEAGRGSFTPLASINKSMLISGVFSTMHGREFLIYKRGDQIIIG